MICKVPLNAVQPWYALVQPFLGQEIIQKNNEYSRLESEIIKLLALIDSINIIVYSEPIECKKWLENISLHNNIKIRYIG